MAIDLRSDQRASGRLEILGRSGKPAPVDGDPRWSFGENPELGAWTIDEDRMGFNFEPVAGALGTISGYAEVDADLGDGVVTLIATVELNIGAERATFVGLKVEVSDIVAAPASDPAATESTDGVSDTDIGL